MGKISKALEKYLKEGTSERKSEKMPVESPQPEEGEAIRHSESNGIHVELNRETIRSLIETSSDLSAPEQPQVFLPPTDIFLPDKETNPKSPDGGDSPGSNGTEPQADAARSNRAPPTVANHPAAQNPPEASVRSEESSTGTGADRRQSATKPESASAAPDDRRSAEASSLSTAPRAREDTLDPSKTVDPVAQNADPADVSEDDRTKIIRLRKQEKEGIEDYPEPSEFESRQGRDLKTIRPGASPLRADNYREIGGSLITLSQPRSFEAEQFKLLRTAILFPSSGKPPNTILITSALPGDGKSFVASNLAVSFALNLDRRVLLIDADIRKPEIHRRFGIDGKQGLSDYLIKATPLSSLLHTTELKNLTILPGGRPPHNPSELLSSEKMPALLSEISSDYRDRCVIIDSPPPKLTSETSVLARLVDGLILVVRAGETKRELVEELVELLGKDKFLGVVMNYYDMRPSRYYGYLGYGKSNRYPSHYYDSAT